MYSVHTPIFLQSYFIVKQLEESKSSKITGSTGIIISCKVTLHLFVHDFHWFLDCLGLHCSFVPFLKDSVNRRVLTEIQLK